MEKRYKIVYSGQLQTNATLDETARSMSEVFRIPLNKVETLLGTEKSKILKNDLSYEKAKKYHDKLTQIGLQVRLLEIPTQNVQPPSTTPVPANDKNNPLQSKNTRGMISPATYLENKTDTTNPYAPPKSKLSIAREKQFKLVSGWSRFFTWLIDHVFYFILSALIGALLGVLFGHKIMIIFSTRLTKYLFSFSIIIGYYVLFEWTTGRTLGKLIIGTKVVNESGEKPSVGQILGRTLSRFIPFEALTFFGSESRGLHDKLSKTYVVKNR